MFPLVRQLVNGFTGLRLEPIQASSSRIFAIQRFSLEP